MPFQNHRTAVSMLLSAALLLSCSGGGSSSGGASGNGSGGNSSSGSSGSGSGGSGGGASGAVAISAVGPVEPSTTGSGIGMAASPAAYHYIYLPTAAAGRKNVLVLFLGGTYSSASNYTDIAQESARMGYGTLDLSYDDSVLAGDCGSNNTTSDSCYTEFRGTVIFGQGVQYAAGSPSYSSTLISVGLADSVVNRLVNLLDWLALNDPVGGAAYWGQFLLADGSSPYATAHHGNVYPDWSKIVVSGHSQGGGHAAFLAMKLPVAVRRAILFSAPNDNYGNGVSASWITTGSVTPAADFWGLRNNDEGIYGTYEALNWSGLAGIGVGGAGVGGATASIGDGSGAIAPAGAQRLVITVPDSTSALTNHSSTAANGSEPAGIDDAWDYLFTANGAD